MHVAERTTFADYWRKLMNSHLVGFWQPTPHSYATVRDPLLAATRQTSDRREDCRNRGRRSSKPSLENAHRAPCEATKTLLHSLLRPNKYAQRRAPAHSGFGRGPSARRWFG